MGGETAQLTKHSAVSASPQRKSNFFRKALMVTTFLFAITVTVPSFVNVVFSQNTPKPLVENTNTGDKLIAQNREKNNGIVNVINKTEPANNFERMATKIVGPNYVKLESDNYEGYFSDIIYVARIKNLSAIDVRIALNKMKGVKHFSPSLEYGNGIEYIRKYKNRNQEWGLWNEYIFRMDDANNAATVLGKFGLNFDVLTLYMDDHQDIYMRQVVLLASDGTIIGMASCVSKPGHRHQSNPTWNSWENISEMKQKFGLFFNRVIATNEDLTETQYTYPDRDKYKNDDYLEYLYQTNPGAYRRQVEQIKTSDLWGMYQNNRGAWYREMERGEIYRDIFPNGDYINQLSDDFWKRHHIEPYRKDAIKKHGWGGQPSESIRKDPEYIEKSTAFEKRYKEEFVNNYDEWKERYEKSHMDSYSAWKNRRSDESGAIPTSYIVIGVIAGLFLLGLLGDALGLGKGTYTPPAKKTPKPLSPEEQSKANMEKIQQEQTIKRMLWYPPAGSQKGGGGS